MSQAAKKLPEPVTDVDDDPLWRAFLEAPLGPPDPPEVVAAIEEGERLGVFIPAEEVSAELVRQRAACEKPGP